MGWYEAVKDAVVAADQLRNAEMKQKLAAVQMECSKLAEDNARLRQELVDIREKQRVREGMEYRENTYWRHLAESKVEGPYCPKCLDGQQVAARMEDRSNSRWWRCHVCGLTVEKAGRDPHEGALRRERR